MFFQVPSGGGGGGAVAVAGGGGGGGAGEPEEKKEDKEEEKVCYWAHALDSVGCSPFVIRRSRMMTWALGCSINPLRTRSVNYDEPTATYFHLRLCALLRT